MLRGEEPLGAASDLNVDEFLQSRWPAGLPPIPAGQGKPEWPSSMAPLTRGRHGLIWRRRTIEDTQAAATAQVIAAIAATGEPQQQGRFFVPIDLRRHQPDLRSTAWLSLAIDFDVTAGTGWEEGPAAQRLPSYMVPTATFVVEQIPTASPARWTCARCPIPSPNGCPPARPRRAEIRSGTRSRLRWR